MIAIVISLEVKRLLTKMAGLEITFFNFEANIYNLIHKQAK